MRSRAPRCRSGSRVRSPASPHRRARHPRRRGGAVSVRPGGRADAAPGRRWRRSTRRHRARRRGSRPSPAPEFTAARERALAALARAAMRRWALPPAVVVLLLGAWELAARLGRARRRPQHQAVPDPGAERRRPVAVGRPLAARRRRLGHRPGGPARIRARPRARALASRSRSTSPTPCGAPSIRCWSPRRPSR